MSHKVTDGHLARRAVVYVRQSSAGQVKNCLESQRRQYALVSPLPHRKMLPTNSVGIETDSCERTRTQAQTSR